MNNAKKIVLIAVFALLVGFAGVQVFQIISDDDDNNKNIGIVRKATPKEIEDARTAKDVDGITTKYGEFHYEPEASIPSEGVVYSLDEIRKSTKMVIIGSRKYLKVSE